MSFQQHLGQAFAVVHRPHVGLGVVPPVRCHGPSFQAAFVDAVGPEQQWRQRALAQWRHPVREDAVGLGAGASNFADGFDFGDAGHAQGAGVVHALGRRRDHAAVAVGVQGVHVAPIIQDRVDRLRVDAAHVVDLGVRLHGDLPIAIEVEGVTGRQPALVKLEFLPFVGDRTEPIQEGRGVVVEVDENHVAEALAADRFQPPAGEVEAAKIFGVADGEQVSVVVVGPAVVFADEPPPFTGSLGDDGCPAMAAGVVEGIDGAALGVHDQHRLAGILPKAEAAGFRNLVHMAREQPGFAPDVLLLQCEEAGVGVATAGQVGQHREAFRRGLARRFVFHEVAQGFDFLAVHGGSTLLSLCGFGTARGPPRRTMILDNPRCKAIALAGARCFLLGGCRERLVHLANWQRRGVAPLRRRRMVPLIWCPAPRMQDSAAGFDGAGRVSRCRVARMHPRAPETPVP